MSCARASSCYKVPGASSSSRRHHVLLNIYQGLVSLASSAGSLQHLQQRGGINDITTMLASMKFFPTISPFVIDDNNSCSPYEHAPPLTSSPPLWHQWQRVSTYLSLKSLITANCSLVFAPPVNMHDPRTFLYAWSNHPFSFEFILQPHELKVC